MVFRILMLGAFVGIAYFAFLRRNRLPINLALIFLILGAGACLIVFPPWSTWLAQRLGIGRGADLVTYLFEIGLLFMAVHQASRSADLESKLVAVARELALLRAERGDYASGHADPVNINAPTASH